MNVQSRDTDPRAEAMQIKLLRQAGASKRAAMTMRLTQSTFALSLQNIQRQHPELNEQECRIKLFEMLHGPELTQKVQAHMEHLKCR